MMEIVNKPEEPAEVDGQEEDPYAYLERDFSSEKFKIEIKNMPKFYGISEFRKLLNEKLNLNANKVKITRRNCPFAFVCFRSQEDRDKGLEVLEKFNWKGKLLHATKAKPSPDPLVKKRKEDSEENDANKKIKLDERSQEERLKDSAIPLWNMNYEDQLKMKQDEILKLLKKLGNSMANSNPEIKNWIENQKKLYNGLPCEVNDIRYSEKIEGYRNKCVFTVGMDEETTLPTVGFRIGSYVNGTVGVAPVENLVHIPQCMKFAVKLFQEFVRSSELKVFNPEDHTGHFREVMMRSSSEHLMLVVGMHPQDLSEDALSEFKDNLKTFFSSGPGKDAKVTSLYYQKIVKRKHGGDITPPEHLMGDTHIYETLLGLKFKISPEAFFQVNKEGAELLYNAAIELAQPKEDTTILDVCCGTGTIGICFAKKCQQVLGIEVVPQAIADANENAKLNNIENAQFFVGKAEEILGGICFKSSGKVVTAVVDPPRAGLHKKAILQIRKISKINKVVYVSCNPASAFESFQNFAIQESKTVHGDAFVPTKAIIVDLFPYTRHCELVLCFERWNNVSGEEVVNEENEIVQCEVPTDV